MFHQRNVNSLVLTKEYYSINPQIYDDQFWWKKDDIEFWKKTFNNKNKKILELAAGTGRIGLPLIREGLNYKGIELSSSYCQHANLRFNELCGSPCIINSDMKSFNLHSTFDVIFIGFNSWLHLLTTTDVNHCLKQVKLHMKKESLFYIDIFLPNPLFLYRPKDLAIRVLEFKDSQSNKIIFIDEIIDYNKSSEIAKITWLYSNKNKKILFEFNFNMKMYYPDTMNRLLIDNGLIIQNIWGDYNKNKFSENSVLQIYECKI